MVCSVYRRCCHPGLHNLQNSSDVHVASCAADMDGNLFIPVIETGLVAVDYIIDPLDDLREGTGLAPVCLRTCLDSRVVKDVSV